jgi:predicted nuclease of predicted toxin-antitoxin system
MKVRLYLDEDVDLALASALRQRGIDVLTTQEAGNREQADAIQLDYAIQAGRTFFTHNRGDFVRLHRQLLQEGRSHPGIIVSD